MSSLDPIVGGDSGGCGGKSEDVQLMKVLDRINGANIQASGSGTMAENLPPGDCGAGSNPADGVQFAATEVAMRGLDSFLSGIMTQREVWVIKKTMGLGRCVERSSFSFVLRYIS